MKKLSHDAGWHQIKYDEIDSEIYFMTIWSICTWSSLDKEESLACQIASPFNKKLGCNLKIKLKRLPFKTTNIFVELGSYLASQCPSLYLGR